MFVKFEDIVLELSLLMKLRITVAIATGVIIIGFFVWPWVAPTDPFGTVSVIEGSINQTDMIKLVGFSILASLIAFIVSWPYGKHIAVLAVPFGLAVLAIRSGNMDELIRHNQSASARLELFAQIRWESFFWLAIMAVSLLAVYTCIKIVPQNPRPGQTAKSSASNLNTLINIAIAIGISVLLSKFLLMIFAQAIRIPDNKLGAVTVQVTTAQIAFACLLSFGIAAFVIKKFLDLNYICTIIAAAIVQPVIFTIYLQPAVLEHLAERWPVVFYSNSIASILPIQIVSFGSIGAIVGHWLAVRHSYWKNSGI